MRGGRRCAERLAAVGELAAGIAHELRNPLTSVKLLIQTAAQQLSGRSFGEQDLQVAQRENSRIEATIQGLLDFARPPAPHRVVHDLRSIVQRALNLVEGRTRQQHIRVATELPPDTLLVDADPEQIHQVLVNLLLNSVEAMPAGGVLEVAVRRPVGEHSSYSVAVSDSGEGVSESFAAGSSSPSSRPRTTEPAWDWPSVEGSPKSMAARCGLPIDPRGARYLHWSCRPARSPSAPRTMRPTRPAEAHRCVASSEICSVRGEPRCPNS